MITPAVTFAQTINCNSTPTPAGCLPNPLKVSSVNDILYLAVDIAMYVGVVLAVIFLIYAGFKYISARGNPEKLIEAHHFLLAVIIGISILIGATAIVATIKTTLTSAGVVNNSVFNGPTS
jgi:heme/copper-type cytochrome/quinol oxidase subunit 2